MHASERAGGRASVARVSAIRDSPSLLPPPSPPPPLRIRELGL